MISAEGISGNVALALADGASAPIAALNEGRFRYNTAASRLEFSEHTSPWVPFSALANWWDRTGTNVYPSTITDTVTIGTASVLGSEQLRVVGNTSLQGDITFEPLGGSSYTISVGKQSGTFAENLYIRGSEGRDQSGTSWGYAGNVEIYAGKVGAYTDRIPPAGAAAVVQGGEGGSVTTASEAGAAGGVFIAGGQGGDATGSGDGGYGGAVQIKGGQSPVPTGGGTAVVGGSVLVVAGSGSPDGHVSIGTYATEYVELGAATIPVQVNGAIVGPDDGTGIVFGHTGTGAGEGSALQLETFSDAQRGYLDTSAGTGMLVYSSSATAPQFWDGSTWRTLSATGDSGWTDDGAVVRLTTAADDVAIGVATMLDTEKLRVVGDVGIQGNIDLEAGASRVISINQAVSGYGNNLTVIAGPGAAGQAGGQVEVSGGTGPATAGNGGNALVVGGTGDSANGGIHGAVEIGGAHTSQISLGNSTDNGPFIFLGTGSVTLSGTGQRLVFSDDGWIEMDERATDPTTPAGRGALYTKDDSGDTHLFFRSDDSGAVYQLTPPTASSSNAVDSATAYICPATVVVGDAVYLSGADAVDKADADAALNRPAMGIVSAKPTTTTCTLRYSGELGGYTGLTPGATYYLSTVSGGIVTPTPTGSNVLSQVLGDARNSTTLVIDIERNALLLAS